MRMLDLFSGIGGFHKGFEQAGYTFDWVGFSEIDKYASAVYKHKFPKAEELGDIKLIQPGRDLPDHIDIVCGGFPCQAFSVAGKRKGFDDTRGTLFFEIARILRHYRDSGDPIPCLVLENVKGLLSHDNGRTFATIYRVLSDLGYTIEFQLLNTRWWLPQNRERIYIVGYFGNRGGPQVFPIGEDDEVSDYTSRKNHRKAARKQNGYSRTISSRIHKMGCEDTYIIDKKGNKKNNQDYAATLTGGGHSGGNHSDMDLIKLNQIGTIGKDSEATRVYDANGISITIKDGGGMVAKTGLYKVPEATKKGYAEAEINNPLKGNTSKGWHFEQNVYDSKSILRSLKSTQGSGNKPKVIIPEATKKGNVRVHTTQPRSGDPSKGGHGPLSRDDGNTYCLDTGNSQAVEVRAMTEVRTDEAKELRRKYGKDPRRLKKLKERDDGVTSALTTGQSKESMVKIEILDDYNNKIREDGVTPTVTQHCSRSARKNGIKVINNTSIRRLTPRECNRLQGFSDDHNKYGEMDGKVVEMSDTQRYKQAGNAVTVDVVQAVAKKIKKIIK